MIERKQYMTQLTTWKDEQIIKVITGIRRCGKSTLLYMFRQQLLKEGIQEDQIISINFEELEYEEYLDYHKLYQYIKNALHPTKTTYIFLDEIQKVNQYEAVVDSLYVKEHVDLYITGSNSYLFSGQLATNLRGRYIEISMLPLSFEEFYSLSKGESKEECFTRYMKLGGFPYIQNLKDTSSQIDMYMEGIYHTVLIKDIEERLNRKKLDTSDRNITDVALLKSISKYLSSVIGSPVSIRNITNYFISNERKISPNTISQYIIALCESYLYYPVEPIDITGKELLKSNRKYYIVDIGLRNLILPKQRYDLGFTIENIVYLELLRRGYTVNIGKSKALEIDFIAKKHNAYTYIQVCASMIEEATFERELAPFYKIEDNYEKIVLTLDTFSVGNYNGIKVIYLIDWLLDQ